MEITYKHREILSKCLHDSTSGTYGSFLKGFTDSGVVGEAATDLTLGSARAVLPVGRFARIEEHHRRAIRLSKGVTVYLIEQDWLHVRVTKEGQVRRSVASIPSGPVIEMAVGLVGFENMYVSHYNYMDLFLNEFFQKVLGKTLEQVYCAGVGVSHGDKFYGYKTEWLNEGLSFNHGICIAMLSYVAGNDRPEDMDRGDWVLSKKDVYAPILKAIESRFSSELAGVDNM